MKKILLLVFIGLILYTHAIAGPPQRIVSLAPNVTEILYDLDLGDRVVAVSSYCNYPPEAKKKPKVGGMSNPSLEAIIALRPDMVILTDDGNPRLIAERLARLKIPTHVFRAKRIADLPGEIRALGIAMGVKIKADSIAERIENSISRYAEKGKQSQNLSPRRVLFVVQPEPLMVAGPGTAIHDVLKLLGLQNIASDAPVGYPRFSLEEVVRRAPDIIFMVKTRDGMAASNNLLLKKLKTLDAIRKNRVYYVGDPILRMGPRITEGIEEIARYLKSTGP